MQTTAITIEALSGGQSTKTATSTTSASLPVVTQPTGLPAGAPIRCAVYSDAVGFIRRGGSPTAVSDGSDQIIPANTLVFVHLMAGERLAIILPTGTGNAYFTPNV